MSSRWKIFNYFLASSVSLKIMNKDFLRFNLTLGIWRQKCSYFETSLSTIGKKKNYSEWKKKEGLNLPISSPLKSSSRKYMLTR